MNCTSINRMLMKRRTSGIYCIRFLVLKCILKPIKEILRQKMFWILYCTILIFHIQFYTAWNTCINIFARLRAESLPENYDQLEFLIGKTMNNIKYSNVNESDIQTLDAFLFQTRLDLFEISAAFSKYYFGNT